LLLMAAEQRLPSAMGREAAGDRRHAGGRHVGAPVASKPRELFLDHIFGLPLRAPELYVLPTR
jgi:hypothetical protein